MLQPGKFGCLQILLAIRQFLNGNLEVRSNLNITQQLAIAGGKTFQLGICRENANDDHIFVFEIPKGIISKFSIFSINEQSRFFANSK